MFLPAEAPALVNQLAGRITHRADQKISPAEIVAVARSARVTDGETFVEVPLPGYYAPFKYTAASYTPVPYAVPAAIFWLGRLTSANLLVLFFMARVANLFLATALLYWAVKQMPFLKWVMVLLALTPMALFMRASLSADGIVMAVACLLTSLVLRTAVEDRSAGRRTLGAIVLLTLLLCLTKPIFVLPLLALAFPGCRFASGRARMIFFIALFSVTVGGLRVSSVFSDEVFSALPTSSPVQPRAQASFVIHHPLAFASVLGRTWLDYSPRYFGELIGKLGWVDTPMPGWLIAAWYFLLFLVTFTRGPDLQTFNGRQRSITSLSWRLVRFWSFSLSTSPGTASAQR